MLLCLCSVGTWTCFINRAGQPTSQRAILAVLLAGLAAFLVSLLLLGLAIALSISGPDQGEGAGLTFLSDAATITFQGLLCLPVVLLASVLVATLQARTSVSSKGSSI